MSRDTTSPLVSTLRVFTSQLQRFVETKRQRWISHQRLRFIESSVGGVKLPIAIGSEVSFETRLSRNAMKPATVLALAGISDPAGGAGPPLSSFELPHADNPMPTISADAMLMIFCCFSHGAP